MSSKVQPRRPRGRSAAQRAGSAALTHVMKAWEDLSDQERLTWRTQAGTRRMEGVAYFMQVNLRRLRRGDQ